MPAAVVTGGASGVGYEVAMGLASAGWHVTIADRNREGGALAAENIRGAHRGCATEFRPLDLASLSHVQSFAALINGHGEPLDLLVNNAGILPSLERRETAEGHELSLGIALLGHYALTLQLLPSLKRAVAPRVVTTSSLVQAQASIDFDDLHARRSYEPQRAYNQSKLAALMFALELDARASAAKQPLISLAAHPGIARTAIGDGRRAEPPRRLRDRLEMLAFDAAMRWAAQSAAEGARPLLHAATAPDARGGEFYGPGGVAQFRGAPKCVNPSRKAQDPALRARLWDECGKLTGIRWPQ
ncbi:MAG TPA: SDR family NAD(P)-dependent oxidoreductase [Verrucomicrobiae bacterium]|nr:SDR family NAD(P)-dependent oxidoreductase [Verrucomicrobiae bacterium]